MLELEVWLTHATRKLSKDSTAQVRREIHEHYEAARESAISAGVSSEEAARSAIAELGDPATANCQYRKVLLTAGEARLLRSGSWETGKICSTPWLKAMLLLIPLVALAAAVRLFAAGDAHAARVPLIGAIGLGFMFGAPFLPIYTPSRARTFRIVKWMLLLGIFVLAFGRDTLKFSWLLASCLWPVIWTEWTRMGIRRKLRVADWPKQLYL